MFTRVRGRSGRVTQRCHNSPDGKQGYRVQVTSPHRKRAGDFGNLKKVSRVETRHRTRRVDLRLLAEALGRCRTRWWWWWGGRWKGQNRKIRPLSPYVEKPLNSKVIKSFVSELRSRKCFSCFEIPMFYVIYIWTSHVHFAYSCILSSIFLSQMWHSTLPIKKTFQRTLKRRKKQFRFKIFNKIRYAFKICGLIYSSSKGIFIVTTI